MSQRWSPRSWRDKVVTQQPIYQDPEALDDVLARLRSLPTLVTSWEVESLKAQLAEVARGDRFVLQGGDCSESFSDCNSEVITAKLKILLQMSLILVYGCKKRVIRVGRFAGQYAKPRSLDTESRGEETLPSYRGDLINRSAFTAADRNPDPELLIEGYERAAMTLNFIRALTAGGFADLHHPDYWDLNFVSHSAQAEEYHAMVATITDSIRFLETVTGSELSDIGRADVFASHEGLLLPYEEAQTRQVPRRSGWYDLTTHFPWIGNRTRDIDGAHVEFFRGIANPIGVKIGGQITPDELVRLAEVLNPDREPGRLTLIHRFGADEIGSGLPPLIEAIKKSEQVVVWMCDPMHGNTETTPDGLKTRHFDNILRELDEAFTLHCQAGTWLGGVHFEMTGENVTECLGGARGLSPDDLKQTYKSQVDPRLNYEQALEMALLIARRMDG
ncbi:MAG: 3-deoxy-7-phosphoheptulonate synthase class II [Planctomycetota bacterium]|nr:MAG: 3-deoxy-7-phosphoheptulonate synthase class II [Planctomycetota bacterium]REJ94052.1 MAG: 3-deoxy-7-phosphoheptulonate synthase class II [Planctomycetota bacterium]REK17849.1 MAG: 3-deoxy-7-phosphoheptulonate synthase class II [Planctomycetota bacterium]REK42390.1 MAG: 3-deoxy-7-phosphoheptulonate synthase class II [Planctomycetota bacterium]